MKKIVLFTALSVIISISGTAFSQTHMNLGAGYFGQTVTYPGIVLEFEMEKMHSDKASLPFRVDLGVYVHPRNHYGLFADVNFGFRRYFHSGLFLEEAIGLGVLQSIVHSDGVFQVDENGNVSEGSGAYSPDLMPSLTLGIVYNLTQSKGKQNLIWVRPKLYWQFPHKTTALYNPALQVGFTHTIKTKQEASIHP